MKFSIVTGLSLLSSAALAQEVTTTITSTLITYVTLGGSTFTSAQPITTVLTESAPALNLLAVNTSSPAQTTNSTTAVASSTISPSFNASSVLVTNTSSTNPATGNSSLTATNTQATASATGGAAAIAIPGSLIAGVFMVAANLL